MTIWASNITINLNINILIMTTRASNPTILYCQPHLHRYLSSSFSTINFTMTVIIFDMTVIIFNITIIILNMTVIMFNMTVNIFNMINIIISS